MSEDIVPNSAPPTQAVTTDDTPLAWRAWLEVYRNPGKYPVSVRKKKDGRIDVTMHLPALVDGVWHSIKQHWTCTPAELRALADTLPLDSALGWQYLQAVSQVCPSTRPKRRTSATLMAHQVRQEAQRLYPVLQALLAREDWWSPTFRQMVARVQQELTPTPTALDLTAWLIEHQPHYTWEWLGPQWEALRQQGKTPIKDQVLRRPTANVELFRKQYLGTKKDRLASPHPATLLDLWKGVREVERLLKNVPLG